MLGFSQKEFAKWLNVNELTIRRLESGETPVKNSPTVRILLLNLRLIEIKSLYSSIEVKEPEKYPEKYREFLNKIREFASLPYDDIRKK